MTDAYDLGSPKPLSAEGRQEITRIAEAFKGHGGLADVASNAILQALASERFFRRAILECEDIWRGCETNSDDKFTYWACIFCNAGTDQLQDKDRVHEADCIVLLAGGDR